MELVKLVLERALASLAYGDCTALSRTHSWNCLSALYWLTLASPMAFLNGLFEENGRLPAVRWLPDLLIILYTRSQALQVRLRLRKSYMACVAWLELAEVVSNPRMACWQLILSLLMALSRS